jgi:hypothetical protein
MRWKWFYALLFFVFLAGVLLSVARASPTGGYMLDGWTVDSGGVTSSTGGDYSLSATIGQPDAAFSSGGKYTVSGGFWGGGQEGGEVIDHVVFLPLVVR